MLDIGPKSGQKKLKKQVCPEMTQNGLEMVPIASGCPGNLFLYYNNVFLYQYKGPFFPIIYYPYYPWRTSIFEGKPKSVN